MELLALGGVLFVIASISFTAVGNVTEASRREKLQSDVFALNRAVQVYVANGGDVSSVTDPQEVLERLKTKIDDDVADRQVGLSSSMVDVRVKVVPQTHEESKTDQLRAVWDPEEGRFVLSNTGDSAIKSFVLDDNLAEGESAVESREKSGFLYAGEDNWIWDFEEHPIPPMNIPTVVVTNPTLAGLPSGSDPTGPPSTPPPPGALLSPNFSIPGGKYPATVFNLSVTLTNPNPAGTSTLYYALDGGALTPYTGPVPVPAGSTLVAKAVAGDSRFTDSAKVSQAYIAQDVTLSPPAITPDSGVIDSADFPLTITITEDNPPGSAVIRYAINEGPYNPYSSPFAVSANDTVHAYSGSTDLSLYSHSENVDETYLPNNWSGNSANIFAYGMYSTSQFHLASIGTLNVSGGMRSEGQKIRIDNGTINILGNIEAKRNIEFGNLGGVVNGDLRSERSVKGNNLVTHNGSVKIGSIGTKSLYSLPAPTGSDDPNYAHPITVIESNYVINKPLHLNGTLYVKGNITIVDGQSITGSGALVSKGQIHIKGVKSPVGKSADGLFLYPLTSQIHIADCNDVIVNGVCYAPGAQVHFQKVGNVTINGGIYCGGQIHLADLKSLTVKPGLGSQAVIPPGITAFVLDGSSP